MYDKYNDVERILREDSKNKKRAGIGVYSRASRRGYIRGGVRTQSDFLTAKQRKKLNGEVIVSNMYEEYSNLKDCDLDEILRKPRQEIRGILIYIKKNNTTTAMCKQLGVSSSKLYGLFRNYEVPYEKKEPRKPKESKETTSVITRENLERLSLRLLNRNDFKLADPVEKCKYIESLKTVAKADINEIANFYNLNKGSVYYYLDKFAKISQSNEAAQDAESSHENIIVEPVIEPDSTAENIVNTDSIIESTLDTDSTTDNTIIQENSDDTDRFISLEKDKIDLSNRIKELEQELERLTDKRSGLKLEVSGFYSKQELTERLNSISNLTMESKKYNISVILEEIQD